MPVNIASGQNVFRKGREKISEYKEKGKARDDFYEIISQGERIRQMNLEHSTQTDGTLRARYNPVSFK